MPGINFRRKFFVLDTNIIVDNFVEKKYAHKHLENIKSKVAGYTFFILPNICIAEVYKVIARKILIENAKNLNDIDTMKEYKQVRNEFSTQISRTDQWINIDESKVVNHNIAPSYYNLDFQRYHLLNCQHLYPFIAKFNKNLKTEKNKEISNVDMFIVAQTMELTYLFDVNHVCLLTADRDLIEFGNYLQKLPEPEKKKFSVPDFVKYPQIIGINDRKGIEYFISK